MKIYTETVDSATYELLKKFMSDPFLKDFNLVGGTSLSLQMGHRKSVDLDLFYYGESYRRQDGLAYHRKTALPDGRVPEQGIRRPACPQIRITGTIYNAAGYPSCRTAAIMPSTWPRASMRPWKP